MALKSSNKIDTNVYEIEVTVAPEVFADACKSAYGKNYTQCSTECLEKLINNVEVLEKSINEEVKEEKIESVASEERILVSKDGLKEAFAKLYEILFNEPLFENDVTNPEIRINTHTKDKQSIYSREDIDDMFNFLQ